jgi:hypothetical protein
VTPRGELLLYADGKSTPAARERDAPRRSPWDLALARANYELDLHYGSHPRPSIKRAPLLVERARFHAYRARFAEAIERTRQSRFRAPDNVASEHMYPYFLWHEGHARLLPPTQAKLSLGYVGLERFALYNALTLTRLHLRRPKLVCLNDNFEHAPPRSAVEIVRHFLRRWFPAPSRFERIDSDAELR